MTGSSNIGAPSRRPLVAGATWRDLGGGAINIDLDALINPDGKAARQPRDAPGVGAPSLRELQQQQQWQNSSPAGSQGAAGRSLIKWVGLSSAGLTTTIPFFLCVGMQTNLFPTGAFNNAVTSGIGSSANRFG